MTTKGNSKGNQTQTDEKASTATLANVEKHGAALATMVAALAEPKTTRERNAFVKMRTGGEVHIAAMANVVETHPEFGLPSDSDGKQMGELVDRATRLERLAHALEAAARQLKDASLEARGEAWGSALSIYRVAATYKTLPPDVRASIDSFATFMAAKHTAPKPVDPVAPTAPTTTVGLTSAPPSAAPLASVHPTLVIRRTLATALAWNDS